jgi:transcriptional regulator GlxA family with amidase domain
VTERSEVARIAVLAFDGCMATSVTGPIEFFTVANALSDLIRPEKPVRFECRIVTARRKPVAAGIGTRFVGAAAWPRPDALIVPGIWHATARELGAVTKGLAAEAALLHDFRRRGALIAGVCSGTTLLAEAGLLDGRRATTSWWLGELFRRRYPAVKLALDELVTNDGDVWCAGAATSYQDLCLKLIQRFAGPDVSALTARFMLVDPGRSSQAPYMLHDFGPVAADPAVAKAQVWAKRNLAAPIGLADLARAAAVSPRTLIRRFHDAIGRTPLGYVQQLRIERAKMLLATSTLPVQNVLDRTGYADMSSFRKLFRSRTGMSPKGYRERFRIGRERTKPPARRVAQAAAS